MTEGMMSPERQGWFAGVKDKLRKSFTVEGSKEKFYQKNADLISKATANLSAEDKQAAYAQIEQDALTSAKIDVATHWGATIAGGTAAAFGLSLLSPRIQGVLEQRGGRIGAGIAERGRRASEFFARILRRTPRLEGSSLRPKSTQTMDQFNAAKARSDEYYKGVAKSVGKYERAPGVFGKGPIEADAVTASREIVDRLQKQAELIKRAISGGRLSGEALANQQRKLADIEARTKNLLSGKPEQDQIARLSKRIAEATRKRKPTFDLRQARDKAGTAFRELHPKKP